MTSQIVSRRFSSTLGAIDHNPTQSKPSCASTVQSSILAALMSVKATKDNPVQ
jgi:hypothetical protein